jgi:hypothetical protein
MTCGCGEVDKRHQPTDITREDLQRAADGSGLTLRQAAQHLANSSEEVASAARRRTDWVESSAPGSTSERA